MARVSSEQEKSEKLPVVSSVAEFLDFVREEVNPDCTFIYRGQVAKKRTEEGMVFSTVLMPSLYRQGLPTPRIGLDEMERRLLHDFKRECRPYIAQQPTSEAEWMMLAQHYGLPTRLLDWTFNPLAALFFAVENEQQPYDSHVYQGKVYDYQIYGVQDEKNLADVDTYLRKRFGYDLEKDVFQLIVPPHFDERIQAQAACFTLHPLFEDFGDRNEMLTLFGKTLPFELGARTCLVPATQFRSIKAELYALSISHKTMFPGLDGLCKSIAWRNTGERDFLQKLGRIFQRSASERETPPGG
jgi:hypothetical protein